jgi:hypothetical protein
MYSSLYNEATLTESGEVRAIRHEPDPGMLSKLIPADYWVRANSSLAIWKFTMTPDDA